jgi:hypothetical protein
LRRSQRYLAARTGVLAAHSLRKHHLRVAGGFGMGRQHAARTWWGVDMRAIVILGLALGGSSALAQDFGGYAGLAVGEFDYANEMGGDYSDSVSSWKFFGGFEVGKYFSVEVGRTYASIEPDPPGVTMSVGTRVFGVTQGVDYALTNFKTMGRVPLKQFDLWFAIGAYFMTADVDFTSTFGGPGSISVDDNGELLALGVDWNLGQLDRTFVVRLEYETFDVPFADISTLSVGVAYRFGGL